MAELAHRHTDRMLWASDWPYVGLTDPQVRPASADLIEWLRRLGLDEEQRESILVRNPQRLYGFPAAR